MMKNVFISLLLAVVTAGCSVKEDREACPCRLILDFSCVNTDEVSDVLIYVASEDGALCNEDVYDFYPEYEMDVPRTWLNVNVYEGEDGALESGMGIRIPYGDDCPELYMHTVSIDTGRDTVRDTVILHKNHCVVTMYLNNEDGPEYGLCLKGNVDGYDNDGSPHSGKFSYAPEIEADRSYVAVLPRQTDASLLLEIDDGTGVVKNFALGEYIIAGGYDWNNPDLEDLTVSVDWAVSTVSISVSGWDWEYECEIVI